MMSRSASPVQCDGPRLTEKSASPKPCAAVIASSKEGAAAGLRAPRPGVPKPRLIGEDADIAVSVLQSCGDGQVLGGRSPLADTMCSDRAVDQDACTTAQRGLLTPGSHRIAQLYRLSRTPGVDQGCG